MIALVLLVVAAIMQPRSATCPIGSYVGTVRDGAYRCEQTPARDVCNAKRGCDDHTPAIVVASGRVRCVAGDVAIAADDRHVRCVRRPS